MYPLLLVNKRKQDNLASYFCIITHNKGKTKHMSSTLEIERSENSCAKSKTGSIIAYVLLSIFFHGSIGLSLLALFTLNFQLMIVLTVIVLLQKKLKRNQSFSDYVSKFMHPGKAFNSFKIIDDCQDVFYPEDNQKVIYGFHPHGVYAMGFLCSLNQHEDPSFCSMTGLSSNFILNLPILGGLLRMWGIEHASNHQVKSLMQKGKSIALLPGGFEEATITSPHELRCWINKRKGFIKYAIQHNYAIRPVLVLKEHQAFSTFQAFQKLRLSLNKFKLPGVFFWNKIWGFILPTSLDITVLKGRPVNFNPESTHQKSKTKSTQQLIDKVHKDYILQIQRLYQKYQTLNGDKPLKLY